MWNFWPPIWVFKYWQKFCLRVVESKFYQQCRSNLCEPLFEFRLFDVGVVADPHVLHLFVGQSPLVDWSGGNLVYWANFSQKWNCICFAWKTIITLASACAMQEFQFIQLWKYFMWANKNISFIEFHQSQCLSLCLWVLVLVFRLSGSSAYPKTFVLKALLQKAKSPVATKCHCWPSRRQVDTGYELHGCDIWYTQSRPTRKSFYLLKLSPVLWDYSISCMASLLKLFFCLLKWKFSTT